MTERARPHRQLRCAALAAALALGACDQAEMRDQPKYEAYEAAPTLPGNMAAQHPPAGTVARDEGIAPRPPQPAVTEELLARGRSVFDAVCAPCHGYVGDGQGMVVRRGFPPPPTFHQDRLRDATDDHFYTVMADGFGLMFSYADRVAPDDRWAVVAYIRALQLSQHAPVAELPPELRAALNAAPEEER